MKVVPLGKAKNELSVYVDASQSGRVLIKRHGRPAAILVGVEGQAIEDILTASNEGFWALIEARRAEGGSVSAAAMRHRLSEGRTGRTRSRAKAGRTGRRLR